MYIYEFKFFDIAVQSKWQDVDYILELLKMVCPNKEIENEKMNLR